MKRAPNQRTQDSHFTSDLISATVSTLALVAHIDCAEDAVIDIQFLVGVAALSAFQVRVRVHDSQSFVIRRSSAGDYTNPVGMVLEAGRDGATDDLTITPSGETAWLRLDVSGVEAVEIWAAGTASTIVGAYGAN